MKLLEDDLFQERMQERVAEIEGIIKEFLPDRKSTRLNSSHIH